MRTDAKSEPRRSSSRITTPAPVKRRTAPGPPREHRAERKTTKPPPPLRAPGTHPPQRKKVRQTTPRVSRAACCPLSPLLRPVVWGEGHSATRPCTRENTAQYNARRGRECPQTQTKSRAGVRRIRTASCFTVSCSHAPSWECSFKRRKESCAVCALCAAWVCANASRFCCIRPLSRPLCSHDWVLFTRLFVCLFVCLVCLCVLVRAAGRWPRCSHAPCGVWGGEGRGSRAQTGRENTYFVIAALAQFACGRQGHGRRRRRRRGKELQHMVLGARLSCFLVFIFNLYKDWQSAPLPCAN